MNGLNVSPSKAFDKTLHIATTGDKGPEMGDKDEKMPEEKHATIYHPAALKAVHALFKPAER